MQTSLLLSTHSDTRAIINVSPPLPGDCRPIPNSGRWIDWSAITKAALAARKRATEATKTMGRAKAAYDEAIADRTNIGGAERQRRRVALQSASWQEALAIKAALVLTLYTKNSPLRSRAYTTLRLSGPDKNVEQLAGGVVRVTWGQRRDDVTGTVAGAGYKTIRRYGRVSIDLAPETAVLYVQYVNVARPRLLRRENGEPCADPATVFFGEKKRRPYTTASWAAFLSALLVRLTGTSIPPSSIRDAVSAAAGCVCCLWVGMS
jgi:hypothetical protein